MLQSCNCPEYLEHAEQRLKEEIARVESYLDESSREPLTQVVRRELV